MTDWAVAYGPPTGLAVTVGATVSIVSGLDAAALTFPARSVPCTLKVYAPSGCAAYDCGEPQGEKASAPVVKEHWKVVLGLDDEKVNDGVLTFEGLVGACVIVMIGRTVSTVKG